MSGIFFVYLAIQPFPRQLTSFDSRIRDVRYKTTLWPGTLNRTSRIRLDIYALACRKGRKQPYLGIASKKRQRIANILSPDNLGAPLEALQTDGRTRATEEQLYGKPSTTRLLHQRHWKWDSKATVVPIKLRGSKVMFVCPSLRAAKNDAKHITKLSVFAIEITCTRKV